MLKSAKSHLFISLESLWSRDYYEDNLSGLLTFKANYFIFS